MNGTFKKMRGTIEKFRQQLTTHQVPIDIQTLNEKENVNKHIIQSKQKGKTHLNDRH